MLKSELISELKAMAHNNAEDVNEDSTCDFVKSGNADTEIGKVAFSMFATPEVIKSAAKYGADFLIVHEPTYYNHMDNSMPYEQCFIKKALIDECNMTIFRFHDYAHARLPDLICDGQLKFSGLKGTFQRGKYFAVNRFLLDDEMTTLELAKKFEDTLGIKHLRIVGCRDNKIKTISCCFGTPGHLAEEIDECDIVLTGEICEWMIGEYVRDAMQLGKQKSLIVMGHINSEKFGMKLLADIIGAKHPEIPVKYFDCGDVYTYTDD